MASLGTRPGSVMPSLFSSPFPDVNRFCIPSRLPAVRSDPKFQNASTRALTVTCCLPYGGGVTAALAKSAASLDSFGKHAESGGGDVCIAKLDDWMRDSVGEIVGKLREAPLLVQVHSDDSNGAIRLKTKKAVAEDWPLLWHEWRDGETQSPEGLILVEELRDRRVLEEGGEEENGDEEMEENTKAWGVVIQGKGTNCAPACYLLKTCRVKSCLGMYCTHFCLVKVKGFTETTQSLLTNCWL